MDTKDLSLATLRAADIERAAEWGIEKVGLAYRGNELAGETGEACNVIKKLERAAMGAVGTKASKDDLADELADVVICADLTAMEAGIDLAAAVKRKFNATSTKYGLTTKLND